MNKTSGLDPTNIRFLRILVTTLTVTMIAGIIIVITLLVIKLQPSKIKIPQEITLPKGTKAISYSQGSDWIAIISSDDRIFIFDSVTGKIRKQIKINSEK